MLSNAYFLAKFHFDTAENEPAKNLQIFEKCIFEKQDEQPARVSELRPRPIDADWTRADSGLGKVHHACKLRSASVDCNKLPSAPMLASSVLFAARWETTALAAPGAALQQLYSHFFRR